MSLLYFVPGVSVISPEKIGELGLSYAVKKFNAIGCRVGPNGSSGAIVSSDGQVVGYFPDRQQWTPAPRGDSDDPPFWIGFDREQRPTPETLARTEQLVGQRVMFRDGSVWNVPQLVLWHDSESDDLPAVYSTPLPVMVDVDRFGNPTDGPVVKEYRELFDLGLRVVAKLAGNGDESLTGAQLMHFAANVIGVNYRVGLLELSASVLDCLSTDDARKVMLAAIDWTGYEGALGNWVGRQGRPTTDSDSGSNRLPSVASRDTDPPSDS